jgi:hypothetical protein
MKREFVSDAHLGLQQAIRRVFIGAAWQRCRGHFMRNVLANVHRSRQPIVASLVKTIFAQTSQEEARAQLTWVADQLRQGAAGVADELEAAEDGILASMTFPEEHWSKLHSTNVLERLNREFGTRTRLVGISPSEVSPLRFVTALLMEIDDDWQADKRYIPERSMTPAHAKQPWLPAPAAQLLGPTTMQPTTTSTSYPHLTGPYFLPDGNCLLSVVDHCLRSRNDVKLIVTSKQMIPQWLDMDAAREHCTRSAVQRRLSPLEEI